MLIRFSGPMAAFVLVAALSCSDDETTGIAANSTSTSGAAGAFDCTPQCPTEYPNEGTPCTGDLNCGYGVRSCGCIDGAWQCACCSQANCPGTAPTPGTPCDMYLGAADCWYDVDEVCDCSDGYWRCSC